MSHHLAHENNQITPATASAVHQKEDQHHQAVKDHNHNTKHTDSIMRAEDLLKRQTATIESSEAKTYGGGEQSRGLLADSLASMSIHQ